jgi:hypothetical protein
MRERALELEQGEPQISQWVCIGMLAVTLAVMATTAEWVGAVV